MRNVTLSGEQRLQQKDLMRQGALPKEIMDSDRKSVV